MSVAITIIAALVMFCVLIFIHEFGHFITAKAVGIKVNEFAIGMGPLLWKTRRGETQYSLRAVPIGGFCAMEGEDGDSEDENAFNNKPAWARIIVVIAGSLMNLIFAILVFGYAVFLASGGAASPLRAFLRGFSLTWEITKEMYAVVAGLITGGVSMDALSGPVGIVYTMNDTFQYGMIYVIFLAGIISLNLAVLNMLPFPALDGGRLVFIIIRLFTGNRISDEAEARVHWIGMMLLFMLIIYVTWNDVFRYFGPGQGA